MTCVFRGIIEKGDMNHIMAKKHEITLGPPPKRKPGSLRRTSSIQSHSYDSFLGPYTMWGFARDLYTGADLSAPSIVSQDNLKATISPKRQVSAIEANRCNDALNELLSVPLGGKLRKAMAQMLSQEVEHSTLLHRLLDDTVGASIVTNAAFDAWELIPRDEQTKYAEENGIDNTGLCITYKPGSKAMTSTGQPIVTNIERICEEVPLYDGDPHAWHQFDKPEGPNQLRMRRLDLWQEQGLLHADVAFQDSAAFQDKEERLVFHEYRAEATIEPETYVLQSIKVQNGVLPFAECLQAPATAQSMVGQSIRDFRRDILAQLPGTAGCTHLNDVLRSLQDVVAMSETLNQQKDMSLD